jgi:uncharacterized RmlC-like cupin family protein
MANPTCVVVDGGASYSGVQGFDYFEGISAETTGARGLCMHRLEIPPGGSARPHLPRAPRDGDLRPRGALRSGPARAAEVRAGQFRFIPAGMPHLPSNPSDHETCTALLARTDPNEQESVVLLDEHGRRLG